MPSHRTLAREILVKQPGESLLFAMDFAGKKLPALAADETISSVTSVTATPSGLTIGSAIIADHGEVGDDDYHASAVVKFRVSGGTAGTEYRFEVVVETSDNPAREADGILKVYD